MCTVRMRLSSEDSDLRASRTPASGAARFPALRGHMQVMGEINALVVHVANSAAPAKREGTARNSDKASKGRHMVHHQASTTRLDLLPRVGRKLTIKKTAGHGKGEKVIYPAGFFVSVCVCICSLHLCS